MSNTRKRLLTKRIMSSSVLITWLSVMRISVTTKENVIQRFWIKASNGNDSRVMWNRYFWSDRNLRVGQKVVMIPNQPPMQSDEEFYENYMTVLISCLVDLMALWESLFLFLKIVWWLMMLSKIQFAAITEFVSVGMHAIESSIDPCS